MLHFVFWLSSYHELNDKYAAHFGAKYPGYLVVASQVREGWPMASGQRERRTRTRPPGCLASDAGVCTAGGSEL